MSNLEKVKFICLVSVLFMLFFIDSERGLGQSSSLEFDTNIVTGASQMGEYLPLLKNKRVALVANQTSLVNGVHLADTLLTQKINLKKVFAPEHGFRGEAGAGEQVNNSVDRKTQLPIVSLYGNKLKPTAADLLDIDVVIFDIQDVGVRFYTYLSTLQYVMEACAEKGIPCIVLDRPNPNGFYIDGPVLEKNFSSFVGLNPVPIVYGLTIGEYAGMINGEHWLSGKLSCKLVIIQLKNYDHSRFYKLPVKPSPNLTNMAAIYLYPSLCLFEGTMVSVGRGTDAPFQLIGYPGFSNGAYEFTPKSIPGIVDNPPFDGKTCRGIQLKEFGEMYIRDYKGIYLFWLKSFYQSVNDKDTFFNNFFNKLAGNETLMLQIKDGKSEEEIKLSWKPALDEFKIMRRKYLLYKDFL